ncbi:hypothetical protein ACFKP6_08310 [Streptococcus uberis]|uniref:hypothetical protein n=1 Tax=Streptococcus uberis TaxID=1349 RepID=UPI0038D4AFE3
MVKVEMSYNPYILETKILFNGSQPMINSMVEKFEDHHLRVWKSKLPKILYNEMNGFDFDFLYSGTKTDFEDLRKIFREQGIGEDQVRFFHQNVLEDIHVKEERVDALLTWLKNNQNHRFDLEKFWDQNRELIENDYPVLIINGKKENYQIDGYDLIFENIEDIDELPDDLSFYPIIFELNQSNRKIIYQYLKTIMSHSEVVASQLFFDIDSSLDSSMMTRTLQDLGVEKPQVISSLEDDSIKQYLDAYPISEYIQTIIKSLNVEVDKMESLFEEEITSNNEKNTLTFEKINNIEQAIINTKSALEKFEETDNFFIEESLREIKNDFMSQIQNWKKRKIKITSDIEANNVISEFNREIQKYNDKFIEQLLNLFIIQQIEIKKIFQSYYEIADREDNFNPSKSISIDFRDFSIPDLSNDFRKCRQQLLVSKQPDIKEIFNNFTKRDVASPIETVEKIIYLYQDFRDVATNNLNKYCQDVMKFVSSELDKFKSNLADDYLDHLEEIINSNEEEKKVIEAKLSIEERMQQDDKFWLSEFVDQLEEIERG